MKPGPEKTWAFRAPATELVGALFAPIFTPRLFLSLAYI